uniref:Uncharacterized protein n=1 Tax=Ditylenchus dipsaci TaxID=166011 RepID=A0A915EFT2_9BILA
MNMVLPQRSLVQLDRFNSSSTNVSLDNINFCSTPSGTTSACSSPSTSSMSTPSTVKRRLGSFSTNGAIFSAATNQSRHLLKRSQTGPSQLFASLSLIGPRGLPQFNSSSSNTSISSKTSRATMRSMSNEEDRLIRNCNSKARFSLPQPTQCLQSNLVDIAHLLRAGIVSLCGHRNAQPGTRKRSDSASFHLKEAQSEVPMGCASLYSYKTLEFLHCGTVEAAYNGAWLCHNHIAYLVNLTGVQQLGKSKRRQSCICGEHTRHQLKEICVKISPASSVAEIFDKFMLVNQFIAEARTKGAQILLYNSDAQNLAQAFSIQYCMHYHKISLNYAICHIERAAKLNLDPKYRMH